MIRSVMGQRFSGVIRKSVLGKSALFTWPEGNGGTQSYPNDSSKVIVNYLDMADETDGINLHQ